MIMLDHLKIAEKFGIKNITNHTHQHSTSKSEEEKVVETITDEKIQRNVLKNIEVREHQFIEEVI